MLFFIVLLLAHLQAVLIPAWIAQRINSRATGVSCVLPDGGIALLRFGFVCFSVAAFAELLDHTQTDWIYVNHLSGWNGLFYAGLAGGLAGLTAAATEKRTLRMVVFSIAIAGVAAYPVLGKAVTASLQSVITILFLSQWWKRFRDPLLWVYPICGVVITTVFGAMLSTSGDQIWHVFIGPAGSISLFTLWLILNRAVKRQERLVEEHIQ